MPRSLGEWVHFQERQLWEVDFPLLKRGLKGKNLLPNVANSYLIETTPFRNGIGVRAEMQTRGDLKLSQL